MFSGTPCILRHFGRPGCAKLLHDKLPDIVHKFDSCETVAEMLPTNNIRSIDKLPGFKINHCFSPCSGILTEEKGNIHFIFLV